MQELETLWCSSYVDNRSSAPGIVQTFLILRGNLTYKFEDNVTSILILWPRATTIEVSGSATLVSFLFIELVSLMQTPTFDLSLLMN